MTKTTLWRKLGEWLKRYAPAEIIATCTALIGAFGGHLLTGSLAVAAISGTIGEGIGYYGYFAIRETSRHYQGHKEHPTTRRLVLTTAKTTRDMAIEFGPAELIDSLAFRPLFMYLGPQIVHIFALGILLGKIAADLIFYTIAIVSYELKKRWSNKP